MLILGKDGRHQVALKLWLKNVLVFQVWSQTKRVKNVNKVVSNGTKIFHNVGDNYRRIMNKSVIIFFTNSLPDMFHNESIAKMSPFIKCYTTLICSFLQAVADLLTSQLLHTIHLVFRWADNESGFVADWWYFYKLGNHLFLLPVVEMLEECGQLFDTLSRSINISDSTAHTSYCHLWQLVSAGANYLYLMAAVVGYGVWGEEPG